MAPKSNPRQARPARPCGPRPPRTSQIPPHHPSTFSLVDPALTTTDNGLAALAGRVDDVILALHSVKDNLAYLALEFPRSSNAHFQSSFDSPDGLPSQQQIEAVGPLTHDSNGERHQSSQETRACHFAPTTDPPAEAVRDLEQTHTPARHPAKPYQCTICHGPRCFQNRDDWRKHEKGHEETYKCQLCGPQWYSAASTNMSSARQSSICPFSCKRRIGMVAHLEKSHGFRGTKQTQEEANKFRTSTGKKYWSCGFCIHLLGTFKDRLNHLGKHFEHYLPQDGWQLTTEIQGLLRQQWVDQAWNHLLWARHGQRQPEIFWPNSIDASQLRDRLQMGLSSAQNAQDVAEAAYAASSLSSAPSSTDFQGSIFDDNVGEIGLQQLFDGSTDGGYPTSYCDYGLTATNFLEPTGNDISDMFADSMVLQEASRNPETLAEWSGE